MAFVVLFLLMMGLGGTAIMAAKDDGVAWKDMNPLQVYGMIQELYMSYYYLFVFGTLAYIEWLPPAV